LETVFFLHFGAEKAIAARERHPHANVSQPTARAAVAGFFFLQIGTARDWHFHQHIIIRHFFCLNLTKKTVFFIYF
jgi:hypothetical protein